MADCITSYSKIKSRSTKREQESLLWILCILIQCLINLPCVFSLYGEKNTVKIYPLSLIFIKYGEPLEIFCVAENYSSSDIQFLLDDHHIESEIVNSTTRRLFIKKPEKQSKKYYCQNKKSGETLYKTILVDSPPSDVKDFDCISYNLEILNCSWTGLDVFSPINYYVTFLNEKYLAPPTYHSNTDGRNTKKYCIFSTKGKIKYRPQEEKHYVSLFISTVFGGNNQNFIFDHYSIVKPDPPYDLQVTEKQSHSVDLMWRIPDNMVDFLHCGIDHIIEYQIAKIDNTTQFHRVDAFFLPPKNKTYRFQLSNLPYAHKQYEVRVFIKSKKAEKREFWSEFGYVVFYTDSERPKRPPDTITGAFYKSAYSNNRVIDVYWKQLEEYEEAGTNFTYKVLVSQGNKTQILYSDKNKSSSYVRLNATLNALDITVWSVNDKGSSLNSSHLYIPAEKDTHAFRLTSFTKSAYENGTYELSWDAIKNIDNYTLFWCQHNKTQICVGRMDFVVLDANKSNHVIDLPREYRYQFAIAANNGSKTSGMMWANCDISKDGLVTNDFPVQLKYDVPRSTFVSLKLLMNCALQDKIITGYNITYCPIVQTSGNCDESLNNSYKFISDSKQMQFKIENLIPFTTYQFSLALNTFYGQKTIDSATVFITTPEDRPTNPVNISITDIRNTSLDISWDPPIDKNGIIGKYVIYNYDKEIYVDNVSGTDTSHRQVTTTDLESFTNYSLTVQACNIAIGLCSKPRFSDSITVTTKIGFPSKLRPPAVNGKTNMLHWNPPEFPRGKVNLYEIKKVQDGSLFIIKRTTKLSIDIDLCEEGVSSETYQVRAVNFDGTLPQNHFGFYKYPAAYTGPWSEPSTVVCWCKRVQSANNRSSESNSILWDNYDIFND